MLTTREVIKTFYNALLQRLKKYRGNWEQNDPTADDYIKNRPFYTEQAEIVILPKTTINGEQSVKIKTPLIVGQEYKITWNGVVYRSIAREYDGYRMIGNNAIYEYDSGIENNTGEPFAAETDGDALNLYFYMDDTVTEPPTVSITIFGEKVHKIDKKFLPNMDYISYKKNQNLTYDQQETALSNVGNALYDGVSNIVNGQKSVKYTSQSLSTSEQATARNNIGAAASANVVKYTAQTMTDAQKTQARTNIGAGTGDYNDLTNKPVLATVATSGSYNDLSNKPTIAQSDWNTYSTTDASYIKNRICYDDCKDTNIGLSGITKTNSLDSSSGLYYNLYSTYSDYSTLDQCKDESLLFAMRYPTRSDDKIEFRYKKYSYRISDTAWGVLKCWGNPYLLYLRKGTKILDGTNNRPLSENELNTGEPFLFVLDGTRSAFGQGLMVISRDAMDAGSIYTRIHDIKTLDEKLIPETIARKTDILSPDWNQNDPEAADYVKNRPFYTGDPVETTLIPEQTVVFTDQGGMGVANSPVNVDLVEGNAYTVTFDGKIYECICQLYGGAVLLIGSPKVFGGEDTGEPFTYLANNGQYLLVAYDTETEHTLSLSTVVRPVVQIPEKYLPIAGNDTYGAVKKNDIIIRYYFDRVAPAEEMHQAIDDFRNGKASIHWYGNRAIHAYHEEIDGVNKIGLIFGDIPTRLIVYTEDNGRYVENTGNIEPQEIETDSVRFYDNESGSGDSLLKYHGNAFDTTDRYLEFLDDAIFNGVRIGNNAIELKSPSNKKFQITVDDSGNLTATEVTT